MTSTGKFLEPLGDYTEQQFYDNAFEQAAILAESGVDCLIIETMTDVRETRIDVKAAKDATGLPVIASMAFDTAGGSFRTMMGDTVDKAVLELAEAGADVIGVNCGTIDPMEAAQVIERMRSLTGLPLVAQPNAGKPELADGQVKFDLGPEEFADGVARCFEAGATLVGGCCGTTPAHISALAARLEA
ncbi:MAG: homocysteine S-methyltransferase family protein, partial [Armatimonadota bacterium]